MKSIFSVVLLLLLLVYEFSAQSPSCDYSQNVSLGQKYYIYNPGYPSNYSKGTTCRWQAFCPVNTRCKLDCSEINLPYSPDCSEDKLLVSRTGDPYLQTAEKYCGKGSLTVLSSNRLAVGFVSTSTSQGGRFLCTLTAEAYTCGWRKTTRIVGGQETKVNEFPMMVGLVDPQLRVVYCGGAIIDTQWVLTAAHCVKGRNIASMGVLYGEHDITKADSPATGLVMAEKIIWHQQYADAYDYDIGLVKTVKAIPFSDRVGSACLPFKYSSRTFTGNSVLATGWGTQAFAGADSDYLQKVILDVIDSPTCASRLSTIVPPRTMCTFTPGKDTCQHDSGGPLHWQEPSSDRLYLVGVVMGGYGCASSKPSLNSRVTEYLSWIVTNSPGAYYCSV